MIDQVFDYCLLCLFHNGLKSTRLSLDFSVWCRLDTNIGQKVKVWIILFGRLIVLIMIKLKKYVQLFLFFNQIHFFIILLLMQNIY